MLDRIRVLAVAAGLAASSSVLAQNVTVSEPWVRGTVAQQTATGAFMRLESDADAALVGAASPVAGKVEIHTTIIQDGIARMRPMPRVELPAGRAVRFEPGGMHVMLLDLSKPLAAGDRVPLTLRVEGRDRKIRTVELEIEVRSVAGGHADHSKPH